MTSLTERYLAAALAGIPPAKRDDVEGELRSSIDDAIEDRVAAGADRAQAEKAVLEGLGNPSRLASEYAGRPLHLIGPELYLVWRHILGRLVAISLPIVAVIQVALGLYGGSDYIAALIQGAGTAITVGVHLAFWVTLVFAFLERADAAREAREEIAGATGAWTVDMLPEPSPGRVTAGETVGEIVTTLISIGGLLFLLNLGSVTDGSGNPVSFFTPTMTDLWLPILIGALVVLALFQVVVYVAGRWTVPLAIGHAVIQLAFAVPIIVLALSGAVVNPEFAGELGWPPLAEADGPVMLAIAAVALLVTAWEIVDGFRRALRTRHGRDGAPAMGEATR